MAKYLSERKNKLKVGISGYTEGTPVVDIIGNVGIGTTNATSALWVTGDGYFTGVVTASNFYVGNNIIGGNLLGSGASFSTLYVSGLSTFKNGPVIIGTGSSTGISSQILQVVGFDSSVYIGGNLNVDGSSTLSGNVSLGSSGVSTSLISVIGKISSHLYPDNDGVYNVGRAPQIGSGANRWNNANFYGKGTFDGGVDAHDIEIGVTEANLICSTSSDLQLQAQSGRIKILSNVYVTENNYIGIGTENPQTPLHVVGDTFISGILTATDINSASDIRLKTNIKPFENALDKVVQINGVTFEWKENQSKSAGVIAQELEKVFPELVTNGNYKTVNYNGLIGVLVESIKELRNEVEDLKNRLHQI